MNRSAPKANAAGLLKADYGGSPSTLCKGCGHNSIASQIIQVAFELSLRPHEIIKLSGAMEIAPLLGLSDTIVDIVDTGNTLKANGLEARDTISDISTRLIVNRASMKTKFREVQRLVALLGEVVDGQVVEGEAVDG